MKYSSDTWTLSLPDDWTIDEEIPDMTAFFSPDETRSLHVNDYFKEDGEVTLDDIKEFSGNQAFEKTNLPFLHGVKYRRVDDGEVVLSWWLYMNNHLIVAEYMCLVEQESAMAREIEELIFSLRSFHG